MRMQISSCSACFAYFWAHQQTTAAVFFTRRNFLVARLGYSMAMYQNSGSLIFTSNYLVHIVLNPTTHRCLLQAIVFYHVWPILTINWIENSILPCMTHSEHKLNRVSPCVTVQFDSRMGVSPGSWYHSSWKYSRFPSKSGLMVLSPGCQPAGQTSSGFSWTYWMASLEGWRSEWRPASKIIQRDTKKVKNPETTGWFHPIWLVDRCW